MKKALVFIADGSEEIEALTPVDYLRRAGVDVTLASVGGAPVSDGSGASRFAVRCSHGVSVVADCRVQDCAAGQGGFAYDAVVVPGGMPGATNIAQSEEAVAIIRAAKDAGKLVCAICAAPAVVLPQTGALSGRAWTCYPGMEGQAAEFAAGHRSGVPFVHDSNLITGRGPGAAEEFSMEIVRALCGSQKADEIRAGACQR